MNNLLMKSLLVAACLVLSIATYASAVVVDGYLSSGEYSNSFDAEWYNGHGLDKTRYLPDTAGQETKVRWEDGATGFYLYVATPLTAKYMVWGDEFIKDSGGVLGADQQFYGKDKMSYDEATGSEKLVFGSSRITTVTVDHKGKEKTKITWTNTVTADFDGDATGSHYGAISQYKDSTDHIKSLGISNLEDGYRDTDMPMAFEFMFDYLAFTGTNAEILEQKTTQREALFSDITDNGLEFHLSPEGWAATPPPPAVPEPATVLLLGSGLAGLAFYRRKFKK